VENARAFSVPCPVLYVVVPAVFPAAVRATGTGFSMSMGRVGAVTGPLLAGLLMAAGFDRPVYFAALALNAARCGLPLLLQATRRARKLSQERACGRFDLI
jgi:MFS family permease